MLKFILLHEQSLQRPEPLAQLYFSIVLTLLKEKRHKELLLVRMTQKLSRVMTLF